MSHLSAKDLPLRTEHNIRAFTSYVDDLLQAASLSECPNEELDFFCKLLGDSKGHAAIGADVRSAERAWEEDVSPNSAHLLGVRE
jgi:hypothetical protein